MHPQTPLLPLVAVLLLVAAPAAASCIFDVTDPAFGADGTDAVDDTDEIQSAIAAVSDPLNGCTNGGIVYIPAGTYLVGDGTPKSINASPPVNPTRALLLDDDNITLRGDGIGRTVLELETDFNATHILTNDDYIGGNSRLDIEKMTLDGNRGASEGDVAGSTHNGIKWVNVDGFSLHEVELRANRRIGLVMENSRNGKVAHSHAVDNGSIGFYAQGVNGEISEHIDFVHTTAVSNGQDPEIGGAGFDMFNSEYLTFAGCRATGNGGDGWNFDSARHVSVSSSESIGNLYGGFAVHGSAEEFAQDIAFAGCVAQDNGDDGFRALSAQGLSYSGCRSVDNDGAGMSFQSWRTDKRVREVTIQGGEIARNGLQGLDFRGVARATVTGVLILSNSQAAPQTHDGILMANGFGDHLTTGTERVNVTGCLINDDASPLPSKTQDKAVRALGNSDYLSVFSTDVRGNFDGLAPITLAGANSTTANNPM